MAVAVDQQLGTIVTTVFNCSRLSLSINNWGQLLLQFSTVHSCRCRSTIGDNCYYGFQLFTAVAVDQQLGTIVTTVFNCSQLSLSINNWGQLLLRFSTVHGCRCRSTIGDNCYYGFQLFTAVAVDQQLGTIVTTVFNCSQLSLSINNWGQLLLRFSTVHSCRCRSTIGDNCYYNFQLFTAVAVDQQLGTIVTTVFNCSQLSLSITIGDNCYYGFQLFMAVAVDQQLGTIVTTIFNCSQLSLSINNWGQLLLQFSTVHGCRCRSTIGDNCYYGFQLFTAVAVDQQLGTIVTTVFNCSWLSLSINNWGQLLLQFPLRRYPEGEVLCGPSQEPDKLFESTFGKFAQNQLTTVVGAPRS